MTTTDNDQQDLSSPELIEFQKLMQEQVRNFSFHNDHIIRGPLCRAMGLVNLLKKESLSTEVNSMVDMLRHELRQMENVTLMISKMLDDNEKRFEK